jgi:predicted PurR-regulated permease PerM
MQISDELRRYLIYGLVGPLVALNLWVFVQIFQYFQAVITFIILAAILALILNYLVRFFERFHLRRSQAVLVVVALFLTLLLVLGFTLVPTLINQATQLIENLPELIAAGDRNLAWLERFITAHNLPLDLDEIIAQLTERIQAIVAIFPELAINTIGQIFTTVFLIVLAFYMLLYGSRFWRGLMLIFPTRLGKALSLSLQQQFHYFFKSQVLLALIMTCFLTPTFLILGINYGLLLAMMVGLFQIVPLFGATIGLSLATLLVFTLEGTWPALKVVAFGVFFQQITDNIIAPRLVGNMTGLNPIWIFISLLIGGRIAGFLGVVLALPIAGTIKTTVETLRMTEPAKARIKIPPPERPESQENHPTV